MKQTGHKSGQLPKKKKKERIWRSLQLDQNKDV
jgi:hypothetical protein